MNESNSLYFMESDGKRGRHASMGSEERSDHISLTSLDCLTHPSNVPGTAHGFG